MFVIVQPRINATCLVTSKTVLFHPPFILPSVYPITPNRIDPRIREREIYITGSRIERRRRRSSRSLFRNKISLCNEGIERSRGANIDRRILRFETIFFKFCRSARIKIYIRKLKIPSTFTFFLEWNVIFLSLGSLFPLAATSKVNG